MKPTLRSVIVALAWVVAVPTTSLAAGEPAAIASREGSPASEMADGEVRKVDPATGKLTLKHGEIRNLDMPGMTMVFVVQDKAMLDSLKPGDKVKFRAVADGTKLIITQIEAVK